MAGNVVVSVPDGRRLDAWASEGSGARAVLVHLGTPSVGRPSKPMSEAASQRGLLLVTYSRPGYGRSTRAPGRSVADCAVDVAAVAAHLGLERLLVGGWSGGGPHALATGALLPDLVESVGTLAGVAPRTPELAWLDGMAEENREEFAAALAGPEALERFLTPAADGLQNATAETIAEALGGLVTEVDRRSRTDDLADYLAATIREAVRYGIWGWCDDDLRSPLTGASRWRTSQSP